MPAPFPAPDPSTTSPGAGPPPPPSATAARLRPTQATTPPSPIPPDLAGQDYTDSKWQLVETLQISVDALKASPDWRLVKSDVLVRATQDSDIFAIAGSLSLAIAKGGFNGGSNAVSAGLAIAINEI